MTVTSSFTKEQPHDALAKVKALALPDVLLDYQKKTIKEAGTSSVLFIEKSRRIGLTWGLASHAVLTSAAARVAGGMDTFYVGFNLDMTREFIDTCASWAKAFSYAAFDVEEFIFKDADAHGETKDIQAFRIRFDSGFEITALTSRPRSLRGRQGLVIIDEAAFHDDLRELMKAALALLMWGGKVIVVSTHNGVDNPFNQYIQDIRAGRLKYGLMKITLDDALKDGLYKRICLVLNKEWSEEAEAEWREEIVNFYGEGADEELFCIPRLSAGAFLPGTLVESRMVETPVIRLHCDDGFVFLPELDRRTQIEEWCDENLKPLLATLDPQLQHFLGEDFGRSVNLTVLWPLVMMPNTMRHTPFTVELHNVPFQQQRQIAWYIMDRLPRFTAAAFDARGNGSQLAEETMQRYGAGRIHCVMITTKWYLEAMPPYKTGLEDGMMTVPRDAEVLNDHRAAVMTGGVAQVPNKETKDSSGAKRHGDSLIAAVMAYWATLQPVIEYGYQSLGKPGNRKTAGPPPHDDDAIGRGGRRFGSKKGAW